MAFTAPVLATDAPPLEIYGNLPTFDDAAISPSGEHVALILTEGDKRQIVIFDSAMQPIMSMAAGDTKLRSIAWAGDELLLLSYSQTEELPFGFTGDLIEVYRVMIVSVDSKKKPETIFLNKRGIANATFGSYGVRKVDGKWTGYYGGILFKQEGSGTYKFDHGRPALMAVDLERNEPKIASYPASEGAYRDWVVGPDGEIAAQLDFYDRDGSWRIENSKGNTIAKGQKPDGRISLISLGTDGTTAIYSTSDEEGGARHFYEVALTGGEPKEILEGKNATAISYNSMTGLMDGYYRESGLPVFFAKEDQMAAQKIWGSFGSGGTNMVDWSDDVSKVIVRRSGEGVAGDWYIVEIPTSGLLKLGSERPDLPADMIGEIRTVDYTAADGLEMDGILTLPPARDAKNLPLVVLPHGGPHSHDSAVFDWWAQAFASRGYAVFQPNFRGSTDQDVTFMRAGYGEWGRKMQTDISDGVAELVKQGIVNPDRACIMGASYGGYAALAGVTIEQGKYKCAVSVGGVSNLDTLYRTGYIEMSGRSKLTQKRLLEELGPRESLKTYSPEEQASKADAPVLLIHGLDDTVVPFEHSKRMADALKNAGKPYKLVELKSEDHWLSRAETRNQMLKEAIAFVEKYNPAN
ncbi:prolyl oligopeptidase family serine peptidase [Altererythrobacter indicus]|uniref:Prolyl oligopeptidase family serine peptidase n=2 Tax=Altericroceibacterium indicum TaxID=374177 RepID=A0A845A4W7_9SPHN|nr:prolyl oligopeptidase family serine peptidase [Altericroceibacterium indicum]